MRFLRSAVLATSVVVVLIVLACGGGGNTWATVIQSLGVFYDSSTAELCYVFGSSSEKTDAKVS